MYASLPTAPPIGRIFSKGCAKQGGLPTKLRFLGHAAFELTDGQTTLLIDPFISGNPLATVKATDLKPNYILVTHFHSDHLGDTVEIAKRTGATVITTAEGAGILQKQGIRVHPMAIGGKAKFPFGMVRVTLAFHGFGDVGGHACGFVIHMGDRRVYHAGDTALFGDMKLLNGVIEEPGIDVALLPIGDNYTMGPEDAAIAVQWIRPKIAIPMHFNTFPLIQVDPTLFTSRVAKTGESKTVVLQPNQSYEF